jgi:hypothetical protein
MPATVFDERFTPRKGKWMLVLALSAAFVSGAFLVVNHPTSPWDRYWAYASIVFFGLGGCVALAQLIPGASYLRLTADGLTIRALWRTRFYRWSDIERFGVAEFTTVHRGVPNRHRMVGFDFSASYTGRDRAKLVKGFNRKLTGFEASLSDNYGWDCAELAAHLNRFREQFIASQELVRMD